MDLACGAVVGGKYRLEHLLGEGGMGVVWAATHTLTGKTCALKFLKETTEGDTTSARERFMREARAACAIRHPNVAPVHDVLETADGSPFMVMDLLDGEPLSRFLARVGKLPVEETARLIVPVIDAVSAIHAEGIVHRDLKPDNVFITRGASGVDIKVLDFGIAKVVALGPDGTSTPTLTATGTMMGTPYYMAPEQIFGDKDVDARADVWALGVILYECLGGRRPTEGDGVGQVLKVIATDAIRPLADVATGVPADLADAITSMLSRDRAARPDLHVVRDLLARHLPVTSSRAPVRAAPSAPPQIVSDTDVNPLADTSLREAVAPTSARPGDLEGDRWPSSARGGSSTSKSGKLLWTAILVGCSGLAAVGFFTVGPGSVYVHPEGARDEPQKASNAFGPGTAAATAAPTAIPPEVTPTANANVGTTPTTLAIASAAVDVDAGVKATGAKVAATATVRATAIATAAKPPMPANKVANPTQKQQEMKAAE